MQVKLASTTLGRRDAAPIIVTISTSTITTTDTITSVPLPFILLVATWWVEKLQEAPPPFKKDYPFHVRYSATADYLLLSYPLYFENEMHLFLKWGRSFSSSCFGVSYFARLSPIDLEEWVLKSSWNLETERARTSERRLRGEEEGQVPRAKAKFIREWTVRVPRWPAPWQEIHCSVSHAGH